MVLRLRSSAAFANLPIYDTSWEKHALCVLWSLLESTREFGRELHCNSAFSALNTLTLAGIFSNWWLKLALFCSAHAARSNLFVVWWKRYCHLKRRVRILIPFSMLFCITDRDLKFCCILRQGFKHRSPSLQVNRCTVEGLKRWQNEIFYVNLLLPRVHHHWQSVWGV